MKAAPYIHTFRTSEQCYVYDVNTAKILTVPEAVYKFLTNPDDSDIDEGIVSFVQNMKANGFLKSERVEISEHPATPLLPFYLENRLYHLILQVTQNCNLRCSYCVYSGSYKRRSHTPEVMSVETAERAIDFFIKRTKDSKNISVAFYGGEPLLNFGLVKHCVNYIETRYYGKKIEYYMTTNGTLLDDNMIAFLAENKFHLLISLDGPKEIHDARRMFAFNGKGSFSILMNNIERIKSLQPDYYASNVGFNAVLDTSQGLGCFNEFISGDEIFSEGKFMLNYITNRYTDEEMYVSDEFYADRQYEFFKLFLSKLGEIPRNKTSRLLDAQFFEIYMRCYQTLAIEQDRIPPKFHHSGPCVPVANRFFVATNGKFFPCEQVSELSETVNVGDIEKGLSLDKITQIINPEVVSSSRCRDCWAYRECYICIAKADDMLNVSDEEAQKSCPSVRNLIDGIFKDYCVLRELGYTFDEERLRKG